MSELGEGERQIAIENSGYKISRRNLFKATAAIAAVEAIKMAGVSPASADATPTPPPPTPTLTAEQIKIKQQAGILPTDTPIPVSPIPSVSVGNSEKAKTGTQTQSSSGAGVTPLEGAAALAGGTLIVDQLVNKGRIRKYLGVVLKRFKNGSGVSRGTTPPSPAASTGAAPGRAHRRPPPPGSRRAH